MEGKFSCSQCGKCCQSVGQHPGYADLDRGDGTCRYYDDATRLCSIYSSRPLRCNIDLYYDTFLQGKMTRQEYHRLNQLACKSLQNKS